MSKMLRNNETFGWWYLEDILVYKDNELMSVEFDDEEEEVLGIVAKYFDIETEWYQINIRPNTECEVIILGQPNSIKTLFGSPILHILVAIDEYRFEFPLWEISVTEADLNNMTCLEDLYKFAS